MKKYLSISIGLIFCAMSFSFAQAEYGKSFYSGVYTLDFSDQVKIRVGAAVQNNSTSEWQGGGHVGNNTIDAATFSQLQAATTNKLKIEIKSRQAGTLYKVRAFDLETGKVLNGVYDARKNLLTIGSSKSMKRKGGSSKTQIGVIKGHLSADKSTIENGQFDVGFIAGKAPMLISANATFTFTARKAIK